VGACGGGLSRFGWRGVLVGQRDRVASLFRDACFHAWLSRKGAQNRCARSGGAQARKLWPHMGPVPVNNASTGDLAAVIPRLIDGPVFEPVYATASSESDSLGEETAAAYAGSLVGALEAGLGEALVELAPLLDRLVDGHLAEAQGVAHRAKLPDLP